MVSRSSKGHQMKFLNMIKNMIGIIILIILVFIVGINNVIDSFKSINILYLPIILGLYIFSLFLNTLCIGFLIKKRILFSKLFKYCTLSWVHGLISPAKLGEFSLIYFLKKEKLSIPTSLVIFSINKLITFFLFSIITIIGIYLFLDLRQGAPIILFLIIIIIFLLLVNKTNIFLKFTPKKYKSYIKPFFNTYDYFLKNGKKDIVKNFYFTLIRWIVDGLTIFTIFLSLGIPVNIFYVFVINSITSLSSIVPITTNGLGIRQSVGVYIFSKLNINPAITVNMYLISLSFTYLIAFCFYSYYTFMHKGGAT